MDMTSFAPDSPPTSAPHEHRSDARARRVRRVANRRLKLASAVDEASEVAELHRLFSSGPSSSARGGERSHIRFSPGSSSGGDGMRFFKGGQFVPGGGRAPKGGGWW